MDDVRQRRHIADADTSRDATEVSREGVKETVLADKGKRQLEQPCKEETLWDISLEVFLPFVVAGLGMATTGITLNHVKVSAIVSFSSHLI